MDVEFNAVEVPGEANPLTEGILFHVLRSASSNDPTQIQTGTKQLQEWEKVKGYYPLLQVRLRMSLHELVLIDLGRLLRQIITTRSSLPSYNPA
jgi:hypothetical protein